MENTAELCSASKAPRHKAAAAESHSCFIASQLAPREAKSELAEADIARDHRTLPFQNNSVSEPKRLTVVLLIVHHRVAQITGGVVIAHYIRDLCGAQAAGAGLPKRICGGMYHAGAQSYRPHCRVGDF